MKAAPAMAAVLWLVGAASANGEALFAHAPGRPGLRWFDLMKLVVTDLSPDGPTAASGSVVVPLEHIEGASARIDPPETISLSEVDVMPIPGDPGRIILLADLGQSEGFVADATVLALFALTPRPRLLDVVEVGVDRWTGFRQGPPQMLAPGTPLILIESGHDNSNEAFTPAEMIFPHGEKFALVDRVFTFSDRFCAYKRIQEPFYSTLPVPGGAYRAVQVKVRETVTRSGDDCGEETAKAPSAGVITYRGVWRWDSTAGRFVSDTADWRRFQATTRARAESGGDTP